MKKINTILLAGALLFSTSLLAQNNTQIKDETVIKNYQVLTDGVTTNYTIKIASSKKAPIALETSDKYRTNQERGDASAMLTKRISIDSDLDGIFERMLTLRYETRAEDSFMISPDDDGFNITVDGKNIKYDVKQENYTVDKEYLDLFDIMLSDVK